MTDLSKAKARVERRHSWLGVGKAKGAYNKWSFGEGDTNILKDKPDTFFGKLKGFTKRKRHQGAMAVKDAFTLGAATRDEKKKRYGIRVSDNPHEKLDISHLDAGLHEFIRSAVNHYWLAKKAGAQLYPAQVLMWERNGEAFSDDRRPPAPGPQNTSLAADKQIKRYGDFRHDLFKARAYLSACQQLSAYCYIEIGLGNEDEIGTAGKVFERTYNALPGISPQLFESDHVDIRVPSNALCTRTKNCQTYLEAKIAAQHTAEAKLAWGRDTAQTAFQIAALERMDKLNDPGNMRRFAHHYRRELKEADRREKAMGTGAVILGGGVNASPHLVIGVAVLGYTIGPVKMVLKKLGGQLAKGFLHLMKWNRETPSEALLKADQPEQLELEIHSAERLNHPELQSFGRKIDERILSAARHINDAYDHLETLATLTQDQIAGNQIVPLMREDGPPTTVSPKQADLFYEVAHDLEKGMRYLNDVTIFECALDQALCSLEQADRENFHRLDPEYEAPADD